MQGPCVAPPAVWRLPLLGLGLLDSDHIAGEVAACRLYDVAWLMCCRAAAAPAAAAMPQAPLGPCLPCCRRACMHHTPCCMHVSLASLMLGSLALVFGRPVRARGTSHVGIAMPGACVLHSRAGGLRVLRGMTVTGAAQPQGCSAAGRSSAPTTLSACCCCLWSDAHDHHPLQCAVRPPAVWPRRT